MKPTTHGFTDLIQNWPMVCSNEKLELWRELKMVFVHEIGANPFAAGHSFDPRLGPLAIGFGF